MKERQIRSEGFHRKSRRAVERVERPPGVDGGQGAAPGGGGIRNDQGMAVLRPDRQRGEAGALQRRRTRMPLPGDLGLSLADQRDGHVREGRQVGGADRADRGDDRMEAGIERRGERLRDDQRHTGLADRHAGKAGRHHGADFVDRHRLAHPDGAGEGDAALEGGQIVGRQPGVDPGTEPRCQPIDRNVPVEMTLDDRTGGEHPLAGAFGEGDGAALAGDRGDVVDGEAMVAEDDGALSHDEPRAPAP